MKEFLKQMEIIKTFATINTNNNPIMEAIKASCQVVEAAEIIPDKFVIRLKRAILATRELTPPKPGTGRALLQKAEELLKQMSHISSDKRSDLWNNLRAAKNMIKTNRPDHHQVLKSDFEEKYPELARAKREHLQLLETINTYTQQQTNIIKVLNRYEKLKNCKKHLQALREFHKELEARKEEKRLRLIQCEAKIKDLQQEVDMAFAKPENRS